ncbi:MAG: hypothetical protein LBQ10_00870, partial [Desulfovibrio sp.]|nr:hypothetical protein [Desulfovibrio sp.]
MPLPLVSYSYNVAFPTFGLPYTAAVESGAKLRITEARVNETYKVLGANITVGTYDGWNEN